MKADESEKLKRVDNSQLVLTMTCRRVWNKQQPRALFGVHNLEASRLDTKL